MYFRTSLATLLVTLSAFSHFCAPAAHAQSSASGDALRSVYNDGWDHGDNGGSGFFPWTLGVTSADAGHFIASSANNGFGDFPPPDGDIDTGGRSWGMFANNGATAEAFRGFQPLKRHHRFSVAMDNGFIDPGGAVGMALRTLGGENRFEFLFLGDGNTYLINDSVIGFDTGITNTDQGLDVQLTLTGKNSYDLQVTKRFDGTQHVFSRSLGGPVDSEITNFRGFNADAGAFSQRDLFFNSLAISPIPEPSAFGLFALGMTSLLMLGRRHRR